VVVGGRENAAPEARREVAHQASALLTCDFQ
jgi:hypothetical protein